MAFSSTTTTNNNDKVKNLLMTHLQKAKLHEKYIQALCPFHAETEPSFVYYFDTEYYKCFACGAHGHLNDLLTHLGLPPEPTNIQRPQTNQQDKEELKPFEPSPVDRDLLYDMTEEFFGNLHQISSKQVANGKSIKENSKHQYWLNRKISIKTVAKMGIGCGEDSRGFFYSVPYFWVDVKEQVVKASNISVIAIKKIYPKQAKEGKKDSYAMYPEGIAVPIYNEPAIIYARQKHKAIGIFEGEKDVIMAVDQKIGRTAIGIAGKNAFKTSYIPMLMNIPTVLLFLDNDAIKEMKNIADIFIKYRAEIPNLPVIKNFDWSEYPLPQGGDYTDLVHLNQLPQIK